ncbi:MAG: DUF3857 domain-containing protein [Bacteroidota bacterium]
MSKILLLTLIFCVITISRVFAQNADAEVIQYSKLCVVEKDKLVQTDSVIIQINNRTGDKYAEISIPYSKPDVVSNISARIVSMDGKTVRELKKNDIGNKSAISEMSLYEDDFVRYFQLKHNVYPYRVTYSFQTTYKRFITIVWWTPVLNSEVPVRNSRLIVRIPKEMAFRKIENNTNGFSIDTTSDHCRLQWNASYDKPVKPDIFSQAEKYLPYVIIAPLNFTYGVEGSMESWKTYGNWQYRLIEHEGELPESEKKAIALLIEGVKDHKEIVRILYHYLQDHTRYINVSVGIGGLKPYPAAYVSQNKYGDCKALTNYLKAILKEAGIESFYTNVYAGEQPRDIIPGFTGPQFNHVILAVPLSGDTIWLESTDNTNPFGYVGTFIQNRDALLVSKDDSKLVRTPALQKKDVLSSYTLEFEVSVHGNSRVVLNMSLKGHDFEMFNQLHNEFTNDEKDRLIREFMPFDNYDVLSWELKKQHRDTAGIELHAILDLYKLLQPLGTEYCLSLFRVRLPSFSSPANRHLPLVLPFPVYHSDTLIYNLPYGFAMKTKPDSVTIQTKYGNYSRTLNCIGRKILVTETVELFAAAYSMDQYVDFYAFVQAVKDVETKKIIIKPSN